MYTIHMLQISYRFSEVWIFARESAKQSLLFIMIIGWGTCYKQVFKTAARKRGSWHLNMFSFMQIEHTVEAYLLLRIGLPIMHYLDNHRSRTIIHDLSHIKYMVLTPYILEPTLNRWCGKYVCRLCFQQHFKVPIFNWIEPCIIF